jgi:type I restriction enzyme S subunit
MKWPIVEVETIKASERNALVGGPFGSDLTSKSYVEDGVPVIRGNNLPDHTVFNDGDFVFVSDEKALSLSANTAGPRDLIFTQRGTLGQVGLIPDLPNFPRYVISQSQMKLTVDASKAEPRFVYYYFRLPTTVETIKNHVSSSGVPHINLGVLRRFKIPLPPLKEQRRIVEVAAAYDDLMENNRRRMALLEESARLLYREWFVHLRFPGREHTRLINGLPQGWERVPLGEVMTLQRGHDLPSQDRVEGDVPIVSSSGITGFHDKKKADAPGVVTGRYGTLGQVYYIDRDYWPLNTALYVTDFKGNPPLYILHLLKHALESIQSDKAAIPGLNRNVVHSMKVLGPPASLRATFGDFSADVYRQISILTDQTQKLRTARDLLLPRLMSGEIEL